MRYWILFSVLILVFSATSCSDDDFNSSPNVQLVFSSDTLSFDTLFTGIASATLQVKVYNKNSNNVLIRNIELGQKEESKFRLNINGIAKNCIQDVELRAKDSLYIFVETTPESGNRDLPFLIKDSIVFELGEKEQDIKLRAWGQDVHLLKDQSLRTQTWTGLRPYLVYGKLVVEENETLTIEPGTSIFFHRNAGLEVKGTLKVEGNLEFPVSMQGDRLEDLYEDVPGQWEGVKFLSGSRKNQISHLLLKNAKYGLVLESDSPDQIIDMDLSCARIMNMTNQGVKMKNAALVGNNLLLANCGKQLLQIEETGSVEVYHSTFANYWGLSFRAVAAVDLDLQSGEAGKVKMGNCIIYGNSGNELVFGGLADAGSWSFDNCLIRNESGNLPVDSDIFKNCLFNEAPLFVDNTGLDYRLLVNSSAVDAGNQPIGSLFPFDLMGTNRTLDVAPDIGAFEYVEEE
jgi:hypothetical protein